MQFRTFDIEGPALIDLKLLQDDRGFFARTFCTQEFEDAGLNPAVIQCNMSYNYKAGTLRGLHQQIDPAPEAKLIRCIRGRIVDVIVDMRPESPTYLQHVKVELTADNRQALYVPEYFAHGYLTLEDDCEVTYQVSHAYTPNTERGFRYDDPAFGIDWGAPVEIVSDKDAAWPLFAERDDVVHPETMPAPRQAQLKEDA